MIDVASLITLITLCQTTQAALAGGSKLIESYRKRRLSDVEREMLNAAAQLGTFHILSVNEVPGSWVRVGGKDFLDTGDPAFAAKYLQAFESLCKRGHIVHESGCLFMLTGTGFEVARKLAAR